MRKILLASLFILLISLGFIAGFQPISSSNVTYPSNTITGEKAPIDVCKREDATLLQKLSCADDVKSSYLRFVLTSLITNQDDLVKQLSETKMELANTKEQLKNIQDELKNLKKVVEIGNGSQIISTTGYTEAVVSEEEKNLSGQLKDKEDKGILGFFKRLFR
jgi:hypothetical protein